MLPVCRYSAILAAIEAPTPGIARSSLTSSWLMSPAASTLITPVSLTRKPVLLRNQLPSGCR